MEHHQEQTERLPEKQLQFHDLFLELQRLPHGPEVQADLKRQMHAELVRRLESVNERTREQMLPKVHRALELSLMTEEEVNAYFKAKYPNIIS
jgi:hypothetical protein